MITRHPTRQDWFRVDVEDAKPLLGLPGLHIEGARFVVHRSLLTLLDHPTARSLLADIAPKTTWAARNIWTGLRGFQLRTTQHQAIDFIEPRKSVLLGDDMRLGKTLTAIMCHDFARGPFVVVAPLSTRGVWLGWLKRVFPEHADNIGVLRGRKFDPELVKRPIVFAHYDIIAQWLSPAKIGTLVFDEAHVLTNRQAKRTLAATYLRVQAERVIALTGTPIWDLPSDLWSIVGLVAPAAWGSYHDFCQRYGAPENTGYGTVYAGLSNGTELKERMTEIMLRRRWVDVSEDVPAITRSVVVSEVDDAARRKLDILSAKIQSERTNTAGNLAAYRRQITSTKMTTVKHEITKVISRGEPVVVWTWHKDYADAIAKEFPERAHVIHGDIAPEEREKRIEAWKTSPANVLIATMAVAQVGVDFSHARIAIFAEIDYTPAIIGQAEMRTFSPTRGMDVIFIVANHLVDQRIVRALVRKLSAADPLGVGAAVDAIDALRDAIIGPNEVGDLDRLMEDLLASAA